MSIRSRRLLLLSSSALVLLCFAGVALSQTTEPPPETPATPSPAPEPPAPQPSQPAPETPKAEPGIPPAPGSASHGGSTETAIRAADRARGSRPDDDTI